MSWWESHVGKGAKPITMSTIDKLLKQTYSPFLNPSPQAMKKASTPLDLKIIKMALEKSLTLATMNEVTKYFDSELPEPKHNFGDWYHSPNNDRVERTCLACNLKLQITGQQLSYANTPSKQVSMLESLYIGVNGCSAGFNQSAFAEALDAEMKAAQAALQAEFKVKVEGQFGSVEDITEYKEPELDPNDIPLVIYDKMMEWIQAGPGDEICKRDTGINFRQAKWITFSPGKIGQIAEDSPLPEHTIEYKIFRFRRELVQLQGWWVEIAVRVDTGEPVATVNHQGNWKEMLNETQNQPDPKEKVNYVDDE